MRGVPQVTEKFEMGHRNDIASGELTCNPDPCRSEWSRTFVRSQEQNVKGEQLPMCCLSG